METTLNTLTFFHQQNYQTLCHLLIIEYETI